MRRTLAGLLAFGLLSALGIAALSRVGWTPRERVARSYLRALQKEDFKSAGALEDPVSQWILAPKTLLNWKIIAHHDVPIVTKELDLSEEAYSRFISYDDPDSLPVEWRSWGHWRRDMIDTYGARWKEGDVFVYTANCKQTMFSVLVETLEAGQRREDKWYLFAETDAGRSRIVKFIPDR